MIGEVRRTTSGYLLSTLRVAETSRLAAASVSLVCEMAGLVIDGNYPGR